MKNILILCRVVDNYGDIGFVYRLIRSLPQFLENCSYTVAVSNLSSFAKMNPLVDEKKSVQILESETAEGKSSLQIKILDWNDDKTCFEEIEKNIPDVVLECFQCGRPDWLEKILFNDEFTREVLIVNVEYLTAEEWADDFHLLKSATRKKNIRKINFMPGFTKKTAGFILDDHFMKLLAEKVGGLKNKNGGLNESVAGGLKNKSCFKVLLFSYQKNFDAEMEAFNSFVESKRGYEKDFSLCIYSPVGMSFKSAQKSFIKKERNFELKELPYLSQKEWDSFVLSCDFLMVRGEDSFSRACLSGIPFLWNVYVQDGEFQLVKAHAFLKRMEPFFEEEDFELYKKLTLVYNRTSFASDTPLAPEALSVLEDSEILNLSEGEIENLLYKFLLRHDSIKDSFEKFSSSIIQIGNLAEHLAFFLQKSGI